jgi:hypothetical protein
MYFENWWIVFVVVVAVWVWTVDRISHTIMYVNGKDPTLFSRRAQVAAAAAAAAKNQ